jgi:hypothetical protein
VTVDCGFQVSRSIPGLFFGYEYQRVAIFDAATIADHVTAVSVDFSIFFVYIYAHTQIIRVVWCNMSATINVIGRSECDT